MSSLLSRILSDYESLREYEEGLIFAPKVSVSQVYRRLVALERSENLQKSDSYYQGLCAIEMPGDIFRSMHVLMTQLPQYFSKNMLERRNNVTYVKATEFKDWMATITRIPPLWIISASYLEDFRMGDSMQWHELTDWMVKMNLGQFRYSAMPVPYIPDINFLIDKEHGLDDLHLHLNGTTETDVLWPYLLSNPHRVATVFERNYRKSDSIKKLSEQVMPGVNSGMILKRLVSAKRLRNIILSVVAQSIDLGAVNTKNDENIDLYATELLEGKILNGKELKAMRYGIIEELLFYLLTMKTIEKEENDILAGCFHYYMLIKGMMHRFLVMQQSQIGFAQFQLIAENVFRWDVESRYEKRFLQLAGCASSPFLRVIEGRFSPRLTSLENRMFVDRIVTGFENAKKKCPELLAHAELRLIAHFIKKPDRNIGEEIRHQALRKELKRKAVALYMFKRRDCGKYGKIVKGIDAAASEFDARPEVFAAAYRFLRNNGMEHFTFHAGEDFHHLLSGIRTIFEAMEFLGLQSGDRLGHCTAVGISPMIWKKKVGKYCYLSQGEWLDDLVFVWFLIRETKNENLQSLVLRLESEASALATEIYGSFKHCSELCDAWLMRSLCPIPELNDYTFYALDSPRVKKNKLRSDIEGKMGFALWKDYYGVGDDFFPLVDRSVRNRYEKIIKVEIDDIFTNANLEEIQKIMLKMMTKRNIVIEALPTSNMHISLYDELKDYHLMRWLNIDKDKCMMPSVVLGSDDPGIFMTNIFNEYAIAYLHLEDNEYSPAKRMEKIRHLQEFSEIYRF